MELFEKIKYKKEREIKIFNIPVCHYGEKEEQFHKEKYLDLFPKAYIKVLLDKILLEIDTAYDLIFIIRVNAIGENYLLNFLYEEVAKKNKAKKVCFILPKCNKKYKEIFEMFSNVDVYYTNQSLEFLNSVLTKFIYKYKNRKFIVYHCPLKYTHSYLDNSVIYPQVIKNYVNATNFIKKEIKFYHTEEKIKNKFNNFNFNNFIFINPEVKSLKSLSQSFWDSIYNYLVNNHIEFFINRSNNNHDYNLSIMETCYLASLSKKIITMRTGLSEVLSYFQIPMHVIYTDYKFKNENSSKLKQLSSLKNYPFVNPETIYEYEYMQNDEDLIKQIIERL